MVHLTVNGEEIVTTPGHPFYVPVKGWTKAIQLRAGDRLQLLNGQYVVVEQVQHELLENSVFVYNFEVEDFHTYYVGNDPVLVHNVCEKRPEVVNGVERKMPSTMKISDAVDEWDAFLGDGLTSYNPYTGKCDVNRLFSAYGTRSIRFGNHEMQSLGTSKAHFRYEFWAYNSNTNTVIVDNFLLWLR